jgi:hypothetical protein
MSTGLDGRATGDSTSRWKKNGVRRVAVKSTIVSATIMRTQKCEIPVLRRTDIRQDDCRCESILKRGDCLV